MSPKSAYHLFRKSLGARPCFLMVKFNLWLCLTVYIYVYMKCIVLDGKILHGKTQKNQLF
jgi:hypothetical protein